MRSPAYVRNFEWAVRALDRRGLATTILFEERKAPQDAPGLALVERLSRECRAVSYEVLPEVPLGAAGGVKMAARALQDYLRYFEVPFEPAWRLRPRALAFLPPAVERPLARGLRRLPRARRALGRLAHALDSALPENRRIRAELRARQPLALLVTPLVQFRSLQPDWVRAARRLGIGSALCVFSWDNLTTKGLMHALPDRVAVWNESQREEATALHGAAPESIAITGAPAYDHWFTWRPSRSRDDLCRQLSLSPTAALILYVCSSRFIAERERHAVLEWLRAIRASGDDRLSSAGVIVRPHPLNAAEWSESRSGRIPNFAVFPPGGADPVDDASRSDYYDSLFHADAVVGVNTSALLEGAILDRPVLALPSPEFRPVQEGLPHFASMAGRQGMLRIASSMEEHLDALSRSLADPREGSAGRRRFVEAFIRPGGAEVPPTQRLADAIEALLIPGGGGPGSVESA